MALREFFWVVCFGARGTEASRGITVGIAGGNRGPETFEAA